MPRARAITSDRSDVGGRFDAYTPISARPTSTRRGALGRTADRRLLVIKGLNAGSAKELKKDAELWGDLPSGTRSELVGDIAKILDEAITNIDDVSLRDEKNPALPRALRKLAAAASRIMEQLKPLQGSAVDAAELSNFDQLLDNAETIVQAASKLPPEVVQPRKSKGEKTKTN